MELAKQRGIRLHLDGARLWETQSFYDKPLDEICRGFDSVYVARASWKRSGRGRDDHRWPPPAQIRTSGITAYGSYLGWVASKRTSG